MSSLLEHRESLVDQLLGEQASLDTAVMRFSDWHERQHDVAKKPPSLEKYYKKLIPLGKPGKGEQYAFEVNLDQCTGCKACVVACHALNGLDENESWRDVGVLVGREAKPYVQTITTACHHCAEPGCANGCPVLAYEKDEETGIVRHLDDQCIGCSYCMMKCPYDVPKWNSKRGIVRKCDMCYQRLSVGEAPACVQACPNGAIAIRIVSASEVMKGEGRMLPHAFPSHYTKPSTTYISEREIPDQVETLGRGQLRLEDAHWPLAWMLVLTQMSAGLLLAGWLLPLAGMSLQTQVINIVAALLLAIGIALSVLHLGQPLRAWRCFLGLRKSWLSREIVVFGAFLKLAMLAAILPHGLTTGAAWMTGVLGVYCSVMVYADTRRVFWNTRSTMWNFFGTMGLLGSSGAAAILSWWGPSESAIYFGFAATLIRTMRFSNQRMKLAVALRDESHQMHRSAKVMSTLKSGVLKAQSILFGISTVSGLMGMTNIGGLGSYWAGLSLLSTFAGQILDRHLFFVAVDAPRMVATAGPQTHQPTTT